MEIPVRLRRKARVYAALILVRLQVVDNDIAYEVGRAARRRCWRSAHNFSIAWAMRERQTSRPSASRVPNSGGAVLRPQTATRIGSNNLAPLIAKRPGAGRPRGPQSSRWKPRG